MTSPARLCRIFFPFLALLLVGLAAPGQPKADPATELINKLLADKWKEQKLQPADKTSDAEFIRRASLDIIGRIPTVAELQAFEKDTATDKRAKLVDRLLASKEYAAYWAQLWTNWLLPASLPQPARQSFHAALEVELEKDRSFKELTELLLADTGKITENSRTLYVLSGLGQELPKTSWAQAGRFDAVPVTSRSLRLFLGYRLNYDLPEKSEDYDWQASHFWGVNAFFRQTDRFSHQPANPILELKDNAEFNKSGKIAYSTADGKSGETEAIFLDGKKAPADGKGARRQALAALLTAHPNFAKAYINRLWGEFFGRGLHERPVVDDFSSKHKLIHPELLDGLAKEFVQSGYSTKKLIRAICLSDAYQLKSTTNATNAKPELEVYFSRMPLRVLRPEQLVESVVTAVQPQDAKKAREQLRRPLPLVADGPDWDDRQLHDKIIHTVALLNRRELQDLLNSKESKTMSDAMKLQTGKATFDFVCLTVLGRPSTNDEYARVVKALPLKEGKDPQEAPLQDVLWALLNSSEFILNH